MMWMGKVSGIAAMAVGALFAVNAYFLFATGVAGWVYVGAALGLLVGGFRTLRKMSGGLRLLAGAWGFAAGLLMLPFTTSTAPDAALHDTYYVVADPGAIAFVLIALAGLALTVLHKEK
ncbi:MAG: hypothetical protein J0L81_17535 [Caulobacterales bacterium]|jgi:hypothetical protein|nr:hypothetical protein [Caulobacterales bacterium]